jgi:hypothetical protein
MDFDSYRQALLIEPFDEIRVERILDAYFHSETPYVFRQDAGAHGQFKRNVANEICTAFGLKCHPHHVVVCGSAHLGFSAAPNERFGKPFNFAESDIDVAILLPELFDRWWLELVDPRIVLGKHRSDIAEHLLSGFINPHVVRASTATGKRWWQLFHDLDAGGLKRVRGRIYRDPQFMQNYHRLSVIRGRDWLLGARGYPTATENSEQMPMKL